MLSWDRAALLTARPRCKPIQLGLKRARVRTPREREATGRKKAGGENRNRRSVAKAAAQR